MLITNLLANVTHEKLHAEMRKLYSCIRVSFLVDKPAGRICASIKCVSVSGANKWYAKQAEQTTEIHSCNWIKIQWTEEKNQLKTKHCVQPVG